MVPLLGALAAYESTCNEGVKSKNWQDMAEFG